MTAQQGIFALGTRAHHHLQFRMAPGAEPDALLPVLAGIVELATTVAGVNMVVGLGADLCRRVAPELVPDGLGPFETIVGTDGVELPADQHDLWVWLHASGPDAIFDMARTAASTLEGLATLAAEQPCFAYQASRDLTGFEDGTENPPLAEAPAGALVPEGAPGAGGSVVLVQRWVHDLAAFERLPAADQDQVIGRSKATGEELPDEVRSPRSHVSRVVLDADDGGELEIFRRSTAFGGVLEHGLMFVAFSTDVDRVRRMLRRMVGADDGVRDRLTDFSRSTGGAWYVAPPLEALRRS